MARRKPLPHRFGWILIPGLAGALLLAVAPAAAKQETAVGPARPVPSAPCRQGDALSSLGRVAEAEVAFEHELETGSTVRCAREGLAKIGSQHPCAVAKALMQSGEKAEANKAYLDSLELKPAKNCAGAGADTSSDPSLLDRVKNGGEALLAALGAALLAFAALTLAFIVLVRIQSWIPWLKDRWPAGRIRSATVTIDRLDDSAVEPKLGAGTAALMKRWIEADTNRPWVKLVSGGSATEETWLSKVAEAGDQGKIAAASIGLFLALLPRRHVKVSGELQPAAPSGGPGISVELHRKLTSKGNAVLWADRFVLPVTVAARADTLRKLVVPTAAWVSHQVTTQTGGKALSAKDPMSWALFKTAVEWHRDIQMAKAEELYSAAIQIDGANYGARANLAVLQARAGRFREAIELLSGARETLEEKRMGNPLANPDWYRVSYSLAAEYANWAFGSGKRKQERLERAGELSGQLQGAIAKTLGEQKWGLAAMDRERRGLLSFLRHQLEPSLEVLAAGIQLSRSELESSAHEVESVRSTVRHFAADSSHEPDVEYNLACLYAQAGATKNSRRHLEKAFAGTGPSDRLLFVWRVRHDTTLKTVRAGFCKSHPKETLAVRRAGTSSQPQRSWV